MIKTKNIIAAALVGMLAFGGITTMSGCSLSEYNPAIPDYMKDGAGDDEEVIEEEESVKPEVTQEELIAALDDAYVGVSFADFVGADNQAVIDYIISNGYKQVIDGDSVYWTSGNALVTYSLKDMNGKTLSSSRAAQMQPSEVYLSIETTYPIITGAESLEPLMRQATGADEITGYRENTKDGKKNAVAVAHVGDQEFLVTAQRPDASSYDVTVDLYLGGTQADAQKIAEQYPLD